MRGRWIVLAAATASLAFPGSATATSVSVESGAGNAFSAPVYSIDQGESLEFANNGDRPHDLISFGTLSGGFLFSAPRVSPGDTASVAGVEYLATGTYPFLCSLHPGMESSLSVGSGGTPIERPAVAARILSTSKSALVRSGRVRLSMSTAVAASDVSLRLSYLGKVVASRVVDLVPGSSNGTSLQIPMQVRKKIARQARVRLSVAGSVPFGVFRGASRTFR